MLSGNIVSEEKKREIYVYMIAMLYRDRAIDMRTMDARSKRIDDLNARV